MSNRICFSLCAAACYVIATALITTSGHDCVSHSPPPITDPNDNSSSTLAPTLATATTQKPCILNWTSGQSYAAYVFLGLGLLTMILACVSKPKQQAANGGLWQLRDVVAADQPHHQQPNENNPLLRG